MSEMTRRLLIWDNGESYSDHAIVFFDLGPYSNEFAKAVSSRLRYGDWAQHDGRLLGVGEVRWWEGYTCKLRERVPASISEDFEDDEPEAFSWGVLMKQWPDEVACLRAEISEHVTAVRARYAAMRGGRRG